MIDVVQLEHGGRQRDIGDRDHVSMESDAGRKKMRYSLDSVCARHRSCSLEVGVALEFETQYEKDRGIGGSGFRLWEAVTVLELEARLFQNQCPVHEETWVKSWPQHLAL